jgi:hypothetical protein
MKRINIDHPLLPYPQRLIVTDAIFTWRVNQLERMKALRAELQARQVQLNAQSEQDDSIEIMRLNTGFSKARCKSIVTGATELDDYLVRGGYRRNSERF